MITSFLRIWFSVFSPIEPFVQMLHVNLQIHKTYRWSGFRWGGRRGPQLPHLSWSLLPLSCKCITIEPSPGFTDWKALPIDMQPSVAFWIIRERFWSTKLCKSIFHLILNMCTAMSDVTVLINQHFWLSRNLTPLNIGNKNCSAKYCISLSLFSEVEVLFKSVSTDFPAYDRYFIQIFYSMVSVSPLTKKEKNLSFFGESSKQAG